MSCDPPFVDDDGLATSLRSVGYAVVTAGTVGRLAGVDAAALQSLTPAWDRLAPDAFLRDGGRYRRRRHGSFTLDGDRLTPVPHRAHWQPVDYNALHGGIERWFEPLEPEMARSVALTALLRGFGRVADAIRPGVRPWFIEVHPFRIDCSDGIGRPTPEGAHRDGVDLVVVLLVARRAIRGGETRVFDAAGPQGVRFTLAEPFSALLLDDLRVIHESTPIQPERAGQPGWRDTLVLTYRRDGFQDPPPARKETP